MYQVTAAMGAAVETADEISYMFLSAEYALMQRLSIGTGKLIRYHKTENLSKETGLSAEEKQKIDRVLYERKPSKLEEVFQRLYREALGKYSQDPFLIRQFLEAAMDYGSSCLKNYMGDKGAVSEDLEDIVYEWIHVPPMMRCLWSARIIWFIWQNGYKNVRRMEFAQ